MQFFLDVLLSIRSAILYLLLGILISYKPSYTHACVCVCVPIHCHIHHVCVCMCACVCVFVSGYIHICVWFCVGIFVFVCDFMCVSVYSVCVCVYVLGPPGIFERAISLSLSLSPAPLSLLYSVVCWAQSCVKRALCDFLNKILCIF